jgi:hypothetical protein
MYLGKIRATLQHDVTIIKIDSTKFYGNTFSDSRVVSCVQVGQMDGLIECNRALRRLTDTPKKIKNVIPMLITMGTIFVIIV